MASGIQYSLVSESFAKNILKDRAGVGAFQTREFYARQNAIVPKRDRKDRDLRKLFAGKGDNRDLLDKIMK